MGNHQHSARILHEEILQPLDGLHIQMVGRLVQQDDFRIAEQRLRQQHLHLLLGGQAGHRRIENIPGKSQPLDQAAHIGFRLPAVELSKLCLQLSGLDAVFLAEVFFHIDCILFLHDFVQAWVSLNHRIQHGELVVREVVLLQYRHADARLDGDVSGGRLQVARQNPQEGGFPGAIGADNTVAVARGEFQVYILKQGLTAEVQTDICNCNQCFILLLVVIAKTSCRSALQSSLVWGRRFYFLDFPRILRSSAFSGTAVRHGCCSCR